METNTLNTPSEELKLDSDSRASLLSISKWSKVIAAVVFFIAVMGLYYTLEQGVWNPDESINALELIPRLLMNVLWFLFGLLILRFSLKLDKALKMNQQLVLTAAFSSLKSMFKISSILGLIMVFSYVVLELIVNRS